MYFIKKDIKYILIELFHLFIIFLFRLSPRVMGDKPPSPPRRKLVPPPPPTHSSRIPLVDSTASLEWSNLVNVATKAMEGKLKLFHIYIPYALEKSFIHK